MSYSVHSVGAIGGRSVVSIPTRFRHHRAVEATMQRLWERRTLDLQGRSMGVQLICLRTYLGDADLTARAPAMPGRL